MSEEVEKDEEADVWIITLSYILPHQMPFSPNKEYKQFRVRISDGEVLSMKIRRPD